MKIVKSVCFIFIFVCISIIFINANKNKYYIGKIKDTPDITQTDKSLNLSYSGMIQCGPVAVTNAFVWLYYNGYPKLVKFEEIGEINYSDIINILSDLMKTEHYKFTSPKMLVYGIDKYIKDRGYEYSQLKFYDKDYNMKLIQDGLIGKSAVLLFIKWFRYNINGILSKPYSAHWVTLVGYGMDEKNNYNNDVLIIHDPGPYAKSNATEYHKVKLITMSLKDSYNTDYKDCYEFPDFIKRYDKSDKAIIVGIVILKMKNN